MENYDVIIVFTKLGLNIEYNKTKNSFMNGVANVDYMRYLKGIFTNKSRFENRFCKEFLNVKNEMQQLIDDGELDEFEYVDINDWHMEEVVAEWLGLYDTVEPYDYAEAFAIENAQFRALVFTSIDVVDMVNNLGYKRIGTEGIKVNHKKFSAEGEFIGMEENDLIYEVLEVDGTKLVETVENRWGEANPKMYALRCWCTTTNKEHILWIEEQYKDSPLDAVASTCRFPQNWLPYITEMKRQGDVFLPEFKDETPDEVLKNPSSETVALNKEQYFGWLTAQS